MGNCCLFSDYTIPSTTRQHFVWIVFGQAGLLLCAFMAVLLYNIKGRHKGNGHILNENKYLYRCKKVINKDIDYFPS